MNMLTIGTLSTLSTLDRYAKKNNLLYNSLKQNFSENFTMVPQYSEELMMKMVAISSL